MKTRRVAPASLVVCVAALLRPAPAAAQSGAGTGLFGTRERATTRPHSIEFTMSTSDAYDTGQSEPGADPSLPVRRDGSYSNMDAAARYTWTGRNRQVMFNGSDALRYEPELQHTLASSYVAGASFTSSLGRRGRVSLSQGYEYTPYYQFALIPSLPVDPGLPPRAASTDFAVAKQTGRTVATGIAISRSVGRRSTILVDYGRRTVDFGDATRDLSTENASVKFTRQTGRYVGFHVSAATRGGSYGESVDALQTRTNDLEIGLEYTRRGTSFAISSGPSIIRLNGQTFTRMTGTAGLRTQLARTWMANLQVNRSLRFVEAIPYPVLSNSVSAAMSGRLASRLGASTAIGYSSGNVGVSAEGGVYGTYTGSAQLTVSVSRHYALYSEYMYYHYAFDDRLFATALPPRLDRHTMRVGLKLWLPLLN